MDIVRKCQVHVKYKEKNIQSGCLEIKLLNGNFQAGHALNKLKNSRNAILWTKGHEISGKYQFKDHRSCWKPQINTFIHPPIGILRIFFFTHRLKNKKAPAKVHLVKQNHPFNVFMFHNSTKWKKTELLQPAQKTVRKKLSFMACYFNCCWPISTLPRLRLFPRFILISQTSSFFCCLWDDHTLNLARAQRIIFLVLFGSDD